MLNGFKDFILRGNVIDLAVAVVVGTAFTAVVNAIVANLFNPIIGAIFKADSLDSALVVQLGEAQIKFGAVLGAVIQFLIVAIVVYFVFVLPLTHLKKLTTKQVEEEEAAEEAAEVVLLAEIRDLLAAQKQGDSKTPTA